MSDYHLLMSTDKNYLFYMFVTCQTVLDSINVENEPVNQDDCLVFHVLVDSELDMTKAESYVQKFTNFNAGAKIKFSFSFHVVNQELFSDCNTMVRDGIESFTAYYRILFARFMPQNIQQVLYIDIDIIVLDDVRKLFKQHPVDENVFYAAPEFMYTVVAKRDENNELFIEFIGKRPDIPSYRQSLNYCIQSGVLLFNVEQWRQQNMEQKCLEIAANWYTAFYDQDILSKAGAGKISHLSWEWNMTSPLFWNIKVNEDSIARRFAEFNNAPLLYHPTFEQVHRMFTKPSIVHFIGEIKPWSMTRKLTKEEIARYGVSMKYMTAWLQTYARLLQAFKS